MKKKVLVLLLGLVATLSFSIKAAAATPPANITVAPKRGIKTIYVPEFLVSYKEIISTKEKVYCDEINKEYPGGKTLKLGNKIDKGYVYIMQNQPKTSNTDRDYYITQSAVWWYRETINPTKDYTITKFIQNCTGAHKQNSVCVEVAKLVNGAKAYKEPVGSIALSSGTVTFTKSGNNYVSSVITLSSSNLASYSGIKLNNAPAGASIINNKIVNNKGTFQISVPVNSVPAGTTRTFTISTSGTYNKFAMYDYVYNSTYQRVIHEKVFTTPTSVSASKELKVTRPVDPTTTKTPENSLTIRKVDQDGKVLNGAELTLYKGNCQLTSCSNLTVYAAWTTVTTAKLFKNIPVGVYTIVETKTPEGYETAEKAVINVQRNDVNYTHTVVNIKETEEKQVKISKVDITGQTNLPGATLVLKDISGNVIEKWTTTDVSKYFTLKEGTYILTETKAPLGYKLDRKDIYFKVDAEGNVEIKNEDGNFVKAEEIKVINEKTDLVVINKIDKNTNDFLSGAILEIRDENGDVVSTWTTKNESYTINLEPGLYSLRETYTPLGYEQNNEIIYFKVSEDGTLMIRNQNGGFDITGGIIVYNVPEEEYETIIEVPKTGLTSTLTYLAGTMTMVGGAWLLKKNGKINI